MGSRAPREIRSLILLSSILIRVVALAWSLAVMRRLRDWRIALMTAMLALMATRQALTLAAQIEMGGWSPLQLSGRSWPELPGLIVSILAFGFVVVLGRMLEEQRSAVRSLEQKEGQFRDACRVASIGTCEIDLQTKSFSCSQDLRRLLGLTATDDRSFIQLVCSEDRPQLEAHVAAMARGEESHCDLSFCVDLPAGQARIHARGEVVRDRDGTPVRVVGLMADVTERDRIDRAVDYLARGLSGADSGRALLQDLVEFLAKTLNVEIAFVGRLVSPGKQRVETVAACRDGEVVEFDYEYEGTPCQDALEQRLCLYPDGLRELFPDNEVLRDLEIESYAGMPLHNSEGQAIGLLVAMSRRPLDDTKLLRALMRVFGLRAANELVRIDDEERLNLARFALDHAGDAIFVLDESSRIVDVNKTACERLGYSRDELLAMGVGDIDSEFPMDYWPEHWAEVRSKGVQVVQSTHRRRDGSEFPVEIVVAFVPDHGAGRICAFARDVSDRIEREAALRFSKFVVDHAGDAIFTIDEAGRFLAVNDTACARLGRTREEMLELDICDVSPEWSADTWAELWQRMASAGQLRIETVQRSKSGQEIPVEIVGRHLEHKGQHLVVAHVRDVSERKDAEDERSRLESELLHAQKMEAVGTLAGGVAHDFNNLLTAIFGNVEMALTALDDREGVTESLQAIERVAQQGESMTQSLLMFAHKARAEKEPVDLCKLTRDTMKMLRRLLPASIRVTEELPRGESAWVMADIAQLQQVLMNLTLNAQHAMPDGGGLWIGLRKDGAPAVTNGDPVCHGRAVLVVEDTGCGMDAETLRRIFEPFFTTRVRGDGTGLGLAIVHGIVTDHGGRIDVESEPGRGSRFEVSLPLAAAPTGDQAKSAPSPFLLPRPENSASILVAEDNELVRKLVVTALDAVGYSAAGVADGREALERFDEDPQGIQLAILDMDMPHVSGMSCLEELRRKQPELPVVLMTGNPSLLDKARSQLRVPILAKPFQMGSLVELVGDTLSDD